MLMGAGAEVEAEVGAARSRHSRCHSRCHSSTALLRGPARKRLPDPLPVGGRPDPAKRSETLIRRLLDGFGMSSTGRSDR